MQYKFCPNQLISFDGSTYTFGGVICETGESAEATDTRDHTLGDCPDCSDPIWLLSPGTESLAELKVRRPIYLLGTISLSRRMYRKGVPCPYNPGSEPDELKLGGPHVKLVADFTVEYHDISLNPPKKYLARVFVMDVTSKRNKLTRRIGYGVELDPDGPDSPVKIKHYPASETRYVTHLYHEHVITIKQYGDRLFPIITF